MSLCCYQFLQSITIFHTHKSHRPGRSISDYFSSELLLSDSLTSLLKSWRKHNDVIAAFGEMPLQLSLHFAWMWMNESTVFSLLRRRYWCHQCIKKCNIYVAGLCVTVGIRQASHCLILDFLYFEINRSLPLSAAPLWLQASLGQSPNAHL